MVDFRGHRPQHIGYVVEDIQVAVAGLRMLVGPGPNPSAAV